MKKLFNRDNVMFMLMALAIVANVVSIYLPKMIGGAIAIVVTILAFTALLVDVSGKRNVIVQIVLFVFMISSSFGSIKVITTTNHKEQVHHEMVQKERADKRLKQEIAHEVSKQLDQRMAEMKNK